MAMMKRHDISRMQSFFLLSSFSSSFTLQLSYPYTRPCTSLASLDLTLSSTDLELDALSLHRNEEMHETRRNSADF